MNDADVIRMARERKVRLVVCDGYVTSVSDGQRHYIGPMTLLGLYGVPQDVPFTTYPSGEFEFIGWRERPGDIQLHPMRDGNYSLAAAAARAKGGKE